MNVLHHVATGSGKPTLVFVHGFTCDLTDWSGQLATLSAAYRCIAVDLPGHGQSARAGAASIENYAAAVNDTLAALGERDVILVGHSMGCRVVSEACRQKPGNIRALICIDGSLVDNADALARLEKELSAPGAMQGFLDRFYEDFFVESSPAAVRAMINARRDSIDVDHARELLVNFVRWDVTQALDALRAIDVPVLVIQSTSLDSSLKRVSISAGVMTPWMSAVELSVPGATIETLTGVGHFPMLEQAEPTNRLIEKFLRRFR